MMVLLDPEQEAILRQTEPKLHATYNRAGSWSEIVRLELGYPPEVEQKIRELWQHNSQLAANSGEVLKVLDFVEMFVTHNVLGPN